MSRTGRPWNTRRTDDEQECVALQVATVERCAADYASDTARALRASFDAACRARADRETGR